MPKYIDADETKAMIRKRLVTLDAGSMSYAYYSACMHVIDDQPAADVREDTHGLWMEDDYGYNRCSECGYELDHPWEKTLFCPSCGANMEPDDDAPRYHRPRAYWANISGHPRCSRCGEAAGMNPYDSGSRWESQYCPSCGAVMENCAGDGKIDAWNWK